MLELIILQTVALVLIIGVVGSVIAGKLNQIKDEIIKLQKLLE